MYLSFTSDRTTRTRGASISRRKTRRRQNASPDETSELDPEESGTSGSQADDSTPSQNTTNSDEAAQLLKDLLERKATPVQYNKKHRTGTGTYGQKDAGDLSWRRYCLHQFSLKDNNFVVVCCDTSYRSAPGLITHIHRKH